MVVLFVLVFMVDLVVPVRVRYERPSDKLMYGMIRTTPISKANLHVAIMVMRLDQQPFSNEGCNTSFALPETLAAFYATMITYFVFSFVPINGLPNLSWLIKNRI